MFQQTYILKPVFVTHITIGWWMCNKPSTGMIPFITRG